ncbi:CPBP family intramembrane metalloprotease [Priestia aryabhattai]|uniref:CPBP family intramembrane glutamic endopeptidase n=1 Tax=Priestia TaxID=2800373 RepID=UPI002877D5CA|nr:MULTISPECIES: CPBP family intramembrane glutamic endopeptidase [Priestia]MDT0146945.1 CPBP family intramembrane metalloprotease [Priestia aryabhattai]MDT0152723.1 CPBP family intramembrane metalloprotease [Priestia aryabhattai]
MAKSQQELISSMTDAELVKNLYVTQLLICFIALGIGFFTFDSWHSFLQFFELDWASILLYGGGTALLVVGGDMLLMKCVPEHLYDDGGINERLFANRSIPHLALICLIVACSEEVLFRGVIQVQFGLFWASIVFALVHIRYLKKWFLFISVVVLSFLIGLLFWWTENLYVTIFTHFLIDFLLGLQIRKSKGKSVQSEELMQ